jgi:hypothetical protein
MPLEQVRQLNFFHIEHSWRPPKLKFPEIDQSCSEVFEAVNQRWQELGFCLPTRDNLPQLGTKSPSSPGISIDGVGRGLATARLPKVTEIELPDEFKDVIGYFCTLKEGLGTRLPKPWTLSKFFWDKPDSIQERYLNNYDPGAYEDWVREVFGDEVLNPTRPTNISVSIQDSANPRVNTDYVFSLDGRLIRFSQSVPQESKYSKRADKWEDRSLRTSASFRANRLYRLLQEVPNGTFFPDPKGELDNIYPNWLKDSWRSWEHWEGPEATEKDWENYLEKIKNGEEVSDPWNGDCEKMTERKAKTRLLASREYIYYKFPQAFYFRRLSTPPGFIAAEGYSATSKFDLKPYVVKNDNYREIDFSSAQERFSQWLNNLK